MEVKQGLDNQFYKGGVAQEDSIMVLTPDQENAILAIMDWYSQRRRPGWRKYFTLAGAAGTGKSSLIQYVIENLNIPKQDVLCCALTGKATLNLKRKGNNGSNTLHSTIYDCAFTKDGYVFTKKDHINYRLIIIDEASMISEEIFDDIMSFNIPAIFIGDHCQLPPINGDFNIMLKPDFTLHKIMRQAEKSPIIRASQLAIKGEPIPICRMEGFRRVRESDLTDDDFKWADQIVCGFNKNRKILNSVCREIRGFKGYGPNYGERMVVLKNNRQFGVFNGQIIYVNSTPYFNSSDKLWSCKFLDELEYFGIQALMAQDKDMVYKLCDPPLTQNKGNHSNPVYLDFGYVLSVHKAQGSGWNKVMIYEDGFGRDEETKRRWLYTAITRAKKEVLMVDVGK